jgi:hypothetical protein
MPCRNTKTPSSVGERRRGRPARRPGSLRGRRSREIPLSFDQADTVESELFRCTKEDACKHETKEPASVREIGLAAPGQSAPKLPRRAPGNWPRVRPRRARLVPSGRAVAPRLRSRSLCRAESRGAHLSRTTPRPRSATPIFLCPSSLDTAGTQRARPLWGMADCTSSGVTPSACRALPRQPR